MLPALEATMGVARLRKEEQAMTRKEVEFKLERLRAEHDLARAALLRVLMPITTIGLVGGMGLAYVAMLVKGYDWGAFSYWTAIVFLAAIAVFGFVASLFLIFGRIGKLRTEIGRTKALLDMEVGQQAQ
jgi:hypothetical protein